MLCEYFTKLSGNGAVKALLGFFHSIWYIVTNVILMVCSNLFGLELPVFYVFLIFGLLIVLFDEDLKGLVPLVPCAYMSISMKNNPATEVETSAFYQSAFKIQLIFIIVLAAILLLARFISLLIRSEKKKLPKLTFGFIALGVSFILGGSFSPYYSLRTAFFGFVEMACLCGLYFFFYYAVDWKSVDKRYLAVLLSAIGLGVFVEVIGMNVYSGMLTGDVERGALVTGWGMYNNVGCILAICVPAPLYLAATQKRGWLYLIGSLVLVLGLILTQSRGSILFGGIVFCTGLVIALIKCERKERICNFIVLCIGLVALIVLTVIFRHQIREIFASMLEKGMNNNGRFDIYKVGLKQFQEHPIFGDGFYECKAFRWGNLSENAFLPPRYHNTYVQLLATGGIFAFVCYLFHRVETVLLFLKRPSLSKVFMALSIAALILTSLVDCHFFNLGPGLIYAIILVFAEGQPQAVYIDQ